MQLQCYAANIKLYYIIFIYLTFHVSVNRQFALHSKTAKAIFLNILHKWGLDSKQTNKKHYTASIDTACLV